MPTSHSITMRFTIRPLCTVTVRFAILPLHTELQWGSPYAHFSYSEVHCMPTPSYNEVHHTTTSHRVTMRFTIRPPRSYNEVRHTPTSHRVTIRFTITSTRAPTYPWSGKQKSVLHLQLVWHVVLHCIRLMLTFCFWPHWLEPKKVQQFVFSLKKKKKGSLCSPHPSPLTVQVSYLSVYNKKCETGI